jgi:hypothetical protein
VPSSSLEAPPEFDSVCISSFKSIAQKNAVLHIHKNDQSSLCVVIPTSGGKSLLINAALVQQSSSTFPQLTIVV